MANRLMIATRLSFGWLGTMRMGSYLRFSGGFSLLLEHPLGAAADNGLSSQHTLPSLSHY